MSKYSKIPLSKLVKRANTRLARLEQRGQQEQSQAYRYVTSRMARREGEGAILDKSKSGHVKFTTNIRGLSASDQLDLRKEVEAFLETKTSVSKGVKEAEEAIITGFKNKFGREASSTEIRDFFGDLSKVMDKKGFEVDYQTTKRLVKKYGMNEMINYVIKAKEPKSELAIQHDIVKGIVRSSGLPRYKQDKLLKIEKNLTSLNMEELQGVIKKYEKNSRGKGK